MNIYVDTAVKKMRQNLEININNSFVPNYYALALNYVLKCIYRGLKIIPKGPSLNEWDQCDVELEGSNSKTVRAVHCALHRNDASNYHY